MLYRQRALKHSDDHPLVCAGIDEDVGCVRRHEQRLSCPDGRVFLPDDHFTRAFPAQDHLVAHRVAVKSVLLLRLEAVDIAVQILRLLDPLAHKSFGRELFDIV